MVVCVLRGGICVGKLVFEQQTNITCIFNKENYFLGLRSMGAVVIEG